MSPLLDLIEWVDDTGTEIVHRVPPDGTGEFKLGSQLIVRESQISVFFRDGKALDTFGPGRHTLSTANLPVLARILGSAFGGKSPFRCEAVFVNLKTFTDLKWGTKEPVPFRDTELGLVRLRAFGAYTMRVIDPQTFVNEIVGTKGRTSSQEIGAYFKDVIVSRLNDLLGETIKSVFDLPKYYDELGVAAKTRLSNDFSKYGVEIVDFFVSAITPPETVQQMIDERSSMGAIGDMNKFMQYKAATAMGDAANQPGGSTLGAGVGMGMGAGIGMMMPQMISQAMHSQQPASQQQAQAGTQSPVPQAIGSCPKCGKPVVADAKFCPNCGEKIVPTTSFCPQCGQQTVSDAKFCQNCGNKLVG